MGLIRKCKVQGLQHTTYSIEIVQISTAKRRLVLGGALGHDSYEELERTFTRLIAEGAKSIVVDLGNVEELRSSIFGAFLQAMALLRPMGGGLSFVRVRGRGERVFRLLDLDYSQGG